MNTETIEAEAEEPTEQMKCERCGNEIDEDNCLYLEEVGDVCTECYYESVNTCQLCNRDDVLDSELSSYIVVKVELADSGTILPGIYKIKRYPFLSIPLIGSGSIYGDDVLFVDCLPRPDDSFEISGHICKKCAWPYSRIYGQVYGQIKERRLRRGKRGYWPMNSAERRHVRDTFERNPIRLRDLEDDCTYSLNRLRERWMLPQVQTWHEWPFLKWKGVKVYRCYSYDAGWLSLRPEPRFRNPAARHDGVIFAPSGLPTFDMEAAMGRSRSYYERDEKLEREAVIKAINQGLLTPKGFKK